MLRSKGRSEHDNEHNFHEVSRKTDGLHHYFRTIKIINDTSNRMINRMPNKGNGKSKHTRKPKHPFWMLLMTLLGRVRQEAKFVHNKERKKR